MDYELIKLLTEYEYLVNSNEDTDELKIKILKYIESEVSLVEIEYVGRNLYDKYVDLNYDIISLILEKWVNYSPNSKEALFLAGGYFVTYGDHLESEYGMKLIDKSKQL